jgi:hypothetical protein
LKTTQFQRKVLRRGRFNGWKVISFNLKQLKLRTWSVLQLKTQGDKWMLLNLKRPSWFSMWGNDMWRLRFSSFPCPTAKITSWLRTFRP